VSALFVTATGTGIGKTFVTASLIREMRQRGRHVGALKPIASGFDRLDAAASDPGILLTALGIAITDASLDLIAPWRYAAPLSPDMAARREGRRLEFTSLVEHTQQAIANAAGTLLIEGIGGTMVPLDDRHTILDWIAASNLSVLLLGGSYLGAISHALTALTSLRARNIEIAAILINETPGSGVPLDETASVIAQFAGPTKVLALPHFACAPVEHASLRQIADLL
jgi:dethiobiotin synthetase